MDRLLRKSGELVACPTCGWDVFTKTERVMFVDGEPFLDARPIYACERCAHPVIWVAKRWLDAVRVNEQTSEGAHDA